MRVLFDQGVPAPLREYLPGHAVRTAYELGWSRLTNGELLARAERDFDVLITTDRQLQHQQPLAGRRLSILVLPTTNWPRLQTMVERVVQELESIKPGSYREVPL